MMKKFFISTLLSLSILTVFVGCENELEEKYFNPEEAKESSVSGLFTAILNNNRVRASYWNVRTFLLPQPAVYSQTAYFLNSNAMYQQNDSYTGHYWRDFYTSTDDGSGVMGMYKAMEVAYAKLSEENKANNDVLMHAARVVLYDQASQMIDLWGDIPYSGTGSLHTTGTIINPEFDEQVALYNTILAGLKTSSDYFRTITSSALLAKADILLKGDVNKWRRYANSIRLRLLMRVSNVNESTAKDEILAMLNNSADYPLIDGANNANYSPATSDVLLPPLLDNNSNLNDAFREINAFHAPDYMLNSVMLPSNDPRIPVMFDKYGKNQNGVFVPNTEYKAISVTLPGAQQEEAYGLYSILDSATFIQNKMLPGIVITAAEVNFLKAEAFERWGASVDAQTAYETAVKQSVTFYYYLNSITSPGLKIVQKPSDTEINNFVTTSNIAYVGTTEEKLALIWTQKWLHFGVLQSTQAWSEYRRTDYPQLTFPTATLSNFEQPPVRLLYPSIEKSYNVTNYQKVQSKDTRTTKIFWDVN
jgi:hypothetical protein